MLKDAQVLLKLLTQSIFSGDDAFLAWASLETLSFFTFFCFLYLVFFFFVADFVVCL